jgi:hypothetical protein
VKIIIWQASVFLNISGEKIAKWPDCFSVTVSFSLMLIPRIVCLLTIVCLLSSCQSTGSYKITLKDGRQYLCKGSPDFIGKTGYYRYKTFQDRDAMLRADEVLMIEEQGT